MDRNVNIIKDTEGNRIVLINDIIFKGKRSINWTDVENYLKRYVGEFMLRMARLSDIMYFMPSCLRERRRTVSFVFMILQK